MALSAADSVAEIYKDMVIADAPSYSSGISEFTNEQRKTVVEQLGRSGLVSVEEDTAMQNHEAVETFYADYLDGRDSMVTVFEVHRDGLIGAVTFIYRKGELQTYYIGVRWKEGGVPEIQGTSVSNVAEIKLTEKGYFIYAYEYVIAHASLRQYWRIEPLPEDCQELTEKYISGLSYVNYNVLVTNWNSSNVKDILMPCMYEDIYRISTGENLKTEDWKIPVVRPVTGDLDPSGSVVRGIHSARVRGDRSEVQRRQRSAVAPTHDVVQAVVDRRSPGIVVDELRETERISLDSGTSCRGLAEIDVQRHGVGARAFLWISSISPASASSTSAF
jgi:hypothetical protein